MIEIKIRIPEKLSTNTIYRMHHFAKAEFQNLVNDEVMVAVREQKIQPITSYPVRCDYVFYLTGKTLDILNTSGMAKAIEDGLRYAKVFEDDTVKHVKPVLLDEERSEEKYSYVILRITNNIIN